MSEFAENLWAPWRMQYIESLRDGDAPSECFLCDYAAQPEADDVHHVIWRTADTMALLNRFPYTNGHLLIAPLEHRAELTDLSDELLAALFRTTRDAQALLRHVIAPQGFNVGINFGRCAGAGLPGHVHVHVIPRWNGDTNFMAVLGDVRVIPEALDRLLVKLREGARQLGLPGSKN